MAFLQNSRHVLMALMVGMSVSGSVMAEAAPGILVSDDQAGNNAASMQSVQQQNTGDSAQAEEGNGFKSFNDITAALNPLDVLANHDGIQRSIDLNIQFKVNSAEILPAAQRQIEVLSQALNSDRLDGYNIQVIGHTDASGSEKNNMTLSELRALAVVKAMIEGFQVEETRLSGLGKGETALIKGLPANDPRHRRVEIVAIPVQNSMQSQSAESDQIDAQSQEQTQEGEKAIAW